MFHKNCCDGDTGIMVSRGRKSGIFVNSVCVFYLLSGNCSIELMFCFP